MIDISVIIVNYKTPQLAAANIKALLSQQNVRYEIIVVDNHSEDDSLAVLSQFGASIQLLANQENLGFGRANNQAFRISSGRYLFFLNPDAICLSENDLAEAVKWMDTHSNFALAGTRIVSSQDALEKTVFSHYPRQKEAVLHFSHLPGEVAAVLGASMLVRRNAFLQVQGFDETFFLYGEETDLCLRLRKAGYTLGFCEAVTVRHVGGASERHTPSEEILRKKRAGKLLFYRKHYPSSVVKRMMLADLRHAHFHLWRLKLIQWIKGLDVKQQEKVRRLNVVKEMAQAFLKNQGEK
jgi:N-acetylglucosaminyl-diphospho-decaprenol L-rhamnosyltransferase